MVTDPIFMKLTLGNILKQTPVSNLMKIWQKCLVATDG